MAKLITELLKSSLVILLTLELVMISARVNTVPTPCYDDCSNPTEGVCCCYQRTVQCIRRPGQQKLQAIPFNLPADTHQLTISGHNIKKLYDNAFNGFTNLATLSLTNNSIREVDPRAFNSLNKLQRLKLSDNIISTFHWLTFAPLTMLKVLSIKGNKIKTLEAEWFRFNTDLREMYVEGNPIFCDCKIQAFMDWTKSRPKTLILDGADCTNIQRQNILDLNLRCSSTEFPPSVTPETTKQSCYSCNNVRDDTNCRTGNPFYCNKDQLGCRTLLSVQHNGDWSISSGCYSYEQCQAESSRNNATCKNFYLSADESCTYCCDSQRCNKRGIVQDISREHQLTAKFHRTNLACSDIGQRIGDILKEVDNVIQQEPGINSVRHAGWICLDYVPTHFKFFLTRLKSVSNRRVRDDLQLFLMQRVTDGTFSSFTNRDMSRFITVENTGTCPHSTVVTSKGEFVFTNTTIAGEEQLTPCPRPRFYNAYASRNCTSTDDGGVGWLSDINTDDCLYISNKTNELETLAKTSVNEDNYNNVLDTLDGMTVEANNFNSDDIVLTSDSLDNVLNIDTAFEPKNQNDTVQKIVSIVSQMLDTSVASLEQAGSSAERMIHQIDTMSEKLNLIKTTTVKATKDNLSFLTANTSRIRGESVTFGSTLDESGNEVTVMNGGMNGGKHRFIYSVKIPRNLLAKFNYPRATFVLYKKKTFFEAMDDSGDFRFNHTVNSRPLSINLEGIMVKDSPTPIEITFKHFNKSDKPMKCVFWDFGLNNLKGGWSDVGMELVKSELGYSICKSNHLTNFALLMDVYGSTSKLSDTHQKALGIISMVGCIVSIVSLTITLLTYLMFKKLRQSNPSKVLINLCTSLLCLNVSFVIGSMTTANSHNLGACKASAIFTHYFLLSSFAWMLVESFYMYMALIKVLNTYISQFMLKAMLFGWGFPVPILIITLSVYGSSNYGPQGAGEFCWIERKAFYGSVVAPIAVILIANCIVFALVVRRLQQMGNNAAIKNKTQKNKTSKSLRGAIAIFILLGLSWLLAFLAIGDAAVGFSYAFAIINTLQGFAIFLFYVALKNDACQAWLHKLHECFPCIPAPTYFKSSTKGNTMTSQMSTRSSSSSYKAHSVRNDCKREINGSLKKYRETDNSPEPLPTVELPHTVDRAMDEQPIGTPSTYFLNRWREIELNKSAADSEGGHENKSTKIDGD